MEEKLYFKPADYGKGRKKKQVKHKSKSKEKNNHKILKLAGIIIFLAIVAIIIIWLLRGTTTTTGQYPENVKNKSLTCVSSQIQYEKTSWINSDEKELKINTIFNGTDSLKSLSLIYTLTYESEADAYLAEAKSHAQLNEGFATMGYDVRKFSNKFSRYGNKLIITLTTNKTELDEYSASYFLLPTSEEGFVLKSLSDYQNAFEAQGMTCSSTTENMN